MVREIQDAVKTMIECGDFDKIEEKYTQQHRYIDAARVSKTSKILKDYLKDGNSIYDYPVLPLISKCHDGEVLRELMMIMLTTEGDL